MKIECVHRKSPFSKNMLATELDQDNI